MFLKKIEIQGFKSFADKTIIELSSSVTMVIGPNGSGKSNVVDAVRWVLGEQSMKSLRGGKSEDIIFAGTQSRKPVGFAEVNLYVDNGKGTLPIEYEEVVVTRRLYRSGESEYLINKTPCRLKDIQQLFMNTGVGKEGYSIIGQGKVEEILNSKSEDRRYMFEEAAGILKYRYRKNEAERKLEHTKENLSRVSDIINEIDLRLETLCIQSEKAKQYLGYRDELKEKEISLFNYNMQKGTQLISNLEGKYIIVNDDVNKCESELIKSQELKVITKDNLEQMISKQQEIQQFIFDSDSSIERLNSEKAMCDVQKENNIANFAVLEKEITELKTMIITNEEEKANRKSKIDLLLLNRKRFQEDLDQKQTQYDALYSTLSEKGEVVQAKKDIIEAEHEEEIEIKMNINTLRSEIENAKYNFDKLEKEEKEKIHEKDSKKIDKEEIQSELDKITNEKNVLDKQFKLINDRQDDINNKITNFDNSIEEMLHEYRTKKSRYEFLSEIQREREGYGKAVKEILINSQKDKAFGEGIEGSVADIISAPKEYEVAIEMALGGYLQNIVTVNQESAKKCIAFLKQNRFGRASFLPIGFAKNYKDIDISGVKNESGFIGLAKDLVKYDSKYEEIISNLLGKIVIVNTIDDGIKISKKINSIFKIVTLEGDIISGFGQMTGGSVEKKISSILGRNKEIDQLEKEIKKLEVNIEKEKQKKDEYLQKDPTGSFNYSELNEKLNEINIRSATTKQRLDNINYEIENIAKRIEHIKLEKEELLKKNMLSEESITVASEKVVKILNHKLELQKEIEDYSKDFSEEQSVIDSLKEEITDLKISISSFDESNLTYEDMINMINAEIEKAKINIQKKEDQKVKILAENEDFIIKKQDCDKQIQEIIERKDTIGQSVEDVKNEKDNCNNLINNLDKQIEEMMNNMTVLKTDLSKIESKKIRAEEELEALKVKMIEEYEIPLEELLSHDEEVLEPIKVEKEINILKKNIKNLGSINIEAIEEYRESKERFDFLSAQKNDLENTEGKLKELINEITVVMKEQFKVKFALINQQFGVVFERLFGGGKAAVRLTDENDILNCGVEIEAQPPGKKLQNMMLLSGGEKALTAIALLFGILSTNPSPFCILDEIEAALDDMNVFRFAQYIKEYTDNTQFLIITHRKGTMEVAETLYGVTMQEQGITKLVSMKVKE